MNKSIYFAGSLPREGRAPVGGGEVGNLRTVKMLESFGYNVITIRRIRSAASDTVIKRIVTYPLRSLINICKFIIVLLVGTRRNSLVHVSGFYGATIPIETTQVLITKLLGYKLIYEMRGGGASSFYDNGTMFYRMQFKFILNASDCLFSQGKENEALIRSLCDTPIYYYPNCVSTGFYPEKLPSKPLDTVNLLFFGRIEGEKNPLMIVKVAFLLQQQFGNITLSIIGNGLKETIDKVRRAMVETLKKGSYELIPGCEHEQLPELLSNKHFFLFPSEQPREGQSNAVTEAMSFGIIPIASPQGFNRSTIGNDLLIVEELTAEAYADRIATIIREGEIERLSLFVRQRFLENFTEREVFEKMKLVYEGFFRG